jgi:LPXTG-motif cell wall-anchored protein
VPIVAITPERKEVAVASVIQTTPVLEQTQASAATQNGREANGRQLPKTASSLGLVILLGVLFLFLGVGALILARRSRLVPASAL